MNYKIQALCFFKGSLLLACSLPVGANDTAFGGSGASPMPIDQRNIKMVAEEIIIRGQGLNQQDMGGSWHYNCDFTFKNALDKPLSVWMGFPFPVHYEEDNVTAPTGYPIKTGGALVYDFLVTIDNQPVETTAHKIKANEDKGLNYEDAYLWHMNFAPQQTINIHHSYLTGATFDVMGYHWVSYVLKTGALWQNGRIGRTVLKVIPNTPTRLCIELDPKADYLKPVPQGLVISGEGKTRQYHWDLTHFHPTKDLSVCLQTGKNYVRYQIVFPIINLRENSAINVQKMNVTQLRLLRNTIYAQYGRQFEATDLQSYFDKQWWYEPNPDYSDALLTVEDKQALKFIKQVKSRQLN